VERSCGWGFERAELKSRQPPPFLKIHNLNGSEIQQPKVGEGLAPSRVDRGAGGENRSFSSTGESAAKIGQERPPRPRHGVWAAHPPNPGAVPRAEGARTFGPSPDRSILSSNLLHPVLRSAGRPKSQGESKHGHRAARFRLWKSNLSNLLFDRSRIGSLHILPSLRLSVSHLALLDLGQGPLRIPLRWELRGV